MASVNSLKKSVNEFNKKSFSFSNINQNDVRIDTPFCDRHNEAIVLYASEVNQGIRLTDGGYILDDLEADGMLITRSRKKLKILTEQLKAYSVKLNATTQELYIETDIDSYPVKQNLLIQAMLFANDMFMLSKRSL